MCRVLRIQKMTRQKRQRPLRATKQSPAGSSSLEEPRSNWATEKSGQAGEDGALPHGGEASALGALTQKTAALHS